MSKILLRHAWAGHREHWDDDDTQRPLDERGRRQAEELDLDVNRIVSSPYVRCVQSVEPLAAKLGLEVEIDDRLAEGASGDDARALLDELDGGVACTHGDIVEAVIGRSLKKGQYVVLD
jgi:broad specificity phosphatase PhoE